MLATTWMNPPKQHVKSKMSDTKKYTLLHSIYMHLKDRKKLIYGDKTQNHG